MSTKLKPDIGALRIAAFALLLVVSLTTILGFQLLPSRYQIRPGEVSPQTIKSPQRVTFISQVKTERRRDQAAAAVAPVLVHHPEVLEEQLDALASVQGQVSSLRQAPQLGDEERARLIAAIEGITLSPEAIAKTLAFSDEEWLAAVAESSRLLGQALQERISSADLEATKARLTERLDPTLSDDQAEVALLLAQGLIRPNLLVDEAETASARQQAREAVEPVLVAIERGQTILRDGEIAQPEHLEMLEVAGLLNAEIRWDQIGAMAIFVTVLSLILAVYLGLFQPGLLQNGRRLLLLAVVVIMAVLAAKLTIPGRELYAYLFPIAAAPMLIVTLLDAQTALLVAAMLAMLVGYVAGGSLELATVYLAGGLAGLLGVWRAQRLNRFFLAGAAVAATTFSVALAFWLLNPDRDLTRLGALATVALVNGGLSAALTVGSFTLLGHLFDVTTSVHLMELAQPNQPLLRRLLVEAPGTYHHSIIVGNLAERGAELVGADPLLARVGAFYHDVGKVLRPGYFVENQMDGDNIHERLTPEVSAEIVASHVSDGLRLAEENRLPRKVRDFVAEHHGSRLVSFFYHQAREAGKAVNPEDFRYPGPRPQSRETAIVMLADSVEAAVRSSDDHGPEVIDEMVDRMVRERMSEGQLDDCELTLRDIERIKEAFKGLLKGVYHPRLEYPETSPEERGAPSEPEGNQAAPILSHGESEGLR